MNGFTKTIIFAMSAILLFALCFGFDIDDNNIFTVGRNLFNKLDTVATPIVKFADGIRNTASDIINYTDKTGLIEGTIDIANDFHDVFMPDYAKLLNGDVAHWLYDIGLPSPYKSTKSEGQKFIANLDKILSQLDGWDADDYNAFYSWCERYCAFWVDASGNIFPMSFVQSYNYVYPYCFERFPQWQSRSQKAIGSATYSFYTTIYDNDNSPCTIRSDTNYFVDAQGNNINYCTRYKWDWQEYEKWVTTVSIDGTSSTRTIYGNLTPVKILFFSRNWLRYYDTALPTQSIYDNTRGWIGETNLHVIYVNGNEVRK